MLWISIIVQLIFIGYVASIGSDCADPLACLLQGIEIALPNICTLLSSGTEFCIQDLTCQGIQLTSIPTAYTVPTSLELDVTGLGTTCSANFHYGLIHGSMTAALTNVTLDTVTYVEKQGMYPQSVQFTNCQLVSINVDITFSNPLLDLFAPEIAGIIERLVYRKACVELASILSVNVTQFIVHDLDPKLTSIVNSTPDPLPSKDKYGPRYLDWNNSFVSQLHAMMGTVQIKAGSGSAAEFLSCIATGHRPSLPLLTAATADSSGNKYGMNKQREQVWSEIGHAMVQQLFPTVTAADGSLMNSRLSFVEEEEESQEASASSSSSSSTSSSSSPSPKLPFKPISIILTPNATLILRNVEIAGLDTLSDVQVFEPLGDESKVTMRTAATFANLGLNVSMTLVVKRSDAQSTYSQGFVLQLALTDLELLLDLVVAVDDHLLESLYLDQLAGAGCWAQAISEVSIPDLSLKLGSISSLRLQQTSKGSAGQLEHDLAALVNNFFLIATNPMGFGDLTLQLLFGLFQGPLRTTINSQIASSLAANKEHSPCLSHYPYDDETALITWPDSKIVAVLDSLIDDLVGVDGLNQFMSCVTNQTGSLSFSIANMIQISISGLDSFYGLDLFQPSSTSPFNLRSYLAAGYCPNTNSTSANDCNPVAITIAAAPAMIHTLATRSKSLAAAMQQFSLQVSMSNLQLLSEMHVELDFNAFRDLQKNQLQTVGCKQSTVNNASIVNLTLATGAAQISLSSGGKVRDITMGLNAFLQRLLQPAHLDNHNQAMAQSLNEAAATCDNNGITPEVQSDDVFNNGSNSSSSDSDWKWELFILSIGCTLSLAGLLIAYSHWGSATRKQLTNCCFTNGDNDKKMKKRRTADDYYGSSGDDEEDEGEYDSLISSDNGKKHSHSKRSSSRRRNRKLKKQEQEDDRTAAALTKKQSLWARWQCDKALIFQPAVPLWLRVSVPLAICGTIAIFADSNYTPDAVSVMATIVVQGVPHDAGSVFDFGLGNTVKDMWSAGVYPLAILIAFFSGAWPYIKLMAMLWSWIAPPAWLTIDSRETVLITLDALGKWSLVDFFVMVLMLCAFYFNLVVFPDALEVDVTVKPKWGFFSFLLATMISLGLGHCILACHRLIVEPKVLQLSEEEEKLAVETLASHIFEIDLPLSVPILVHEEEDEDEEDDDEEEEDKEASSHAAVPPPLVDEMKEEDGNRDESLLLRAHVPSPSSSALAAGIDHRHHSRNLSRERKAKRQELRLAHQRQALVPKKMFIRSTRLGQVIAVIVVLLEAVCLIAGTFLLTMGFEFKGLTGAMLKDDSKVDYSFITVGNVLPVHSGIPNDFAIRWLQASYFLFGLAMPLSLLLAVLVLLVVPLSLKRQRQLHVLAEVFNAWSTLDVYCAAIAASLLEIQQFAAFIVGDSCDGINKLLEKDAIDEKLDGDDKCFDVIAYLKNDSWVLFVAAAGLLMVGIPILAASHAAIKQRLEANNKKAMASDLAASLSSMAGWEQQQAGNQARSPSPAAINEIPSDLDTPLLIQRWNEGDRPSAYGNTSLSLPTTAQQSSSLRDSHGSSHNSNKIKSKQELEQQGRKPQRLKHLWIFSLRMMAKLQLLEILPDEQISSQQVNQQVVEESGQQSSDEEANNAFFLESAASSSRSSSAEGIAAPPLPPHVMVTA